MSVAQSQPHSSKEPKAAGWTAKAVCIGRLCVVCIVQGLGSEVKHQVQHFGGIDGGVIPCHTVARGTQVATDLPFHHAALKLGPGVLPLSELNARLGGVVQELIVLHPEGSVPGFVVCPTVHGLVCVDVVSLQGQGRTACSIVYSASAVTLRAGVEVQNSTPTVARMMRRNMMISIRSEHDGARFRSGGGRNPQR